MEPRCCCAREVKCCEAGFQGIAHPIHLKEHLTTISPQPGIVTIKFREVKLGKGTRSRDKALRTGCALKDDRWRRVGRVVHERTIDRAWRMGSEEPTAIVPVVVDNAVPAGLLRGRCRWAHLRLGSHVEVERVAPPPDLNRRGRAWASRQGRRRSRCWGRC